jgi:hypothetical protein
MTYLIEANVKSVVVGINDTPTIAFKHESKFKGMPPMAFLDGKKLTTILLSVSLESQGEVDELIDFLRVHKHCFAKP